MHDTIAAVSRATAKRVAADHGPGVVADVEALLQAPENAQRPSQYLDPISLGGLIVAIATLAWNIYTDRQKKASDCSQDDLARHVRIELREQGGIYQKVEDRVVEIVVYELIRASQNHR